MLVQPDAKSRAAGACSDCGMTVQRRIDCIDGMTRSMLELCETCWHAYRQRQVFAGGCCG